ncbi:MAG: hypothetical protein M3Z24_14120 [Chloroflexota bacterium]|nr:hypothetical protein [Chloroflexota bacterium]
MSTNMLLFAIALLGIIAIYGYVLRRVFLYVQMFQRPGLILIAGSTSILGLILLLLPPLFSSDVTNYIMSGHLLLLHMTNFFKTTPLQWIIAGSGTSETYGPLWLSIAALLVSISKTYGAAFFLFRLLALLAHIFNTLLIWAILGAISPNRRLIGTALYAWNPLALLVLVGGGQNEGVVLTLLLLATWLLAQQKGRWYEVGVLVLFGLALSINPILFLLIPLGAWYMVSREPRLSRAVRGFFWRLLISLGVAMLLYLPFWRDTYTFFTLTSSIDLAHFHQSLLGLLSMPVRWFYIQIAQASHFPSIMPPIPAADASLRVSALLIFVIVYCSLFNTIRPATPSIREKQHNFASGFKGNDPSFAALLDSWLIALFWYFVLVSGNFWPWYILWLLWIVALRPIDVRTRTVLLFSCTALLLYPLLNSVSLPIALYQPLLTFGITLIYLGIQGIRQRERSSVAYES